MIKFLQDVFVPLTSLCVGDAYLKYVASAYLFGTLPEKGEDALHAARRDIVSNKALFSGAISVGLPAFMRIKSFLPRDGSLPYPHNSISTLRETTLMLWTLPKALRNRKRGSVRNKKTSRVFSG